MAVGRISGPLLKSNLIRNGIDLAFENDLLYLDVNNLRVGVKTSSPQYELDINGTTRTTNLVVDTDATIAGVNFNNNTISTTNDYLNLGTLDTIVYHNKLRVDSIDIEGNLISSNDSNANIEFRPNGTGTVDIFSNLNVDGSVHVTGNITADGNIVIGDEDTDSITLNAEIASDIIPDVTNTYNLGSVSRQWYNAWIYSVHSNDANIGDMEIRDNYIQTVVSNADLELRGSGTGAVTIDTFTFKDATISSTGNFTISPATGNVQITGTGALKLPTGTTAQRPTADAGLIRYNTDLNTFEGYDNSNWIVLNGVQDLDGNTKITAELTPGANDDTIRFYIAGTQVADITSARFNAGKVIVDDIQIDGNTIETTTADTDLEFDANGTGSIVFDSALGFRNSTITNLVNNGITNFSNTGNGYYKFTGTGGMVIPVGNNTNRPPVINTETGMVRFNTAEQRVEIYDGTDWVSVAGSASGITVGDAESIALELILSLG